MLALTHRRYTAIPFRQTAVAADQKLFIKDCYDSVPSITGIDVYSALSSAKNDYIYYRTDHHWTSYGAYLGYAEAGKSNEVFRIYCR
ncbi:MAG: DHHW family protein [[Eubacterium] siraeum]